MTENLRRETVLEVREWEDEERALGASETDVPIAFASTYPVERMGRDGKPYLEVLSHDPARVDLSRAAAGLPLLIDHGDTQVGRVFNVRIGSDGKARGVARPGNHPDAAWVFADMRAGIRPDISVGYRTGDPVESRDSAGRLVREYAWAPHEISSVAVPADITVGVARTLEDEPASDDAPTETAPIRATTEVAVDQSVTPPTGADNRAKPEWVMEQVEKFKLPMSVARDIVASNVDAVRASEIMWAKISERQDRALSTPASPDLTEREVKSFSIVRAVSQILAGNRDGFEFEVSDALAAKEGKAVNERSILVPWQIKSSGMQKRTNEQIEATGSLGGNLNFTEYAGFVDILRESLVCLQAGVRYIPGLQGDFQWVTKATGTTGGWQSTELTNQSNSAMTFSTVTLAPKSYQDAVIWSRRLMAQSVESVEGLVRDEIAKNHAAAIESAILQGTGTGNPGGIYYLSSTGSVVGGTDGATPAASHVWELYSDVATANGLGSRMGFITHPRAIATLAQTAAFSGGTGGTILQPNVGPGGGTSAAGGNFMMAGYPVYNTSLVKSDITKGSATTCYFIAFGDWSQGVLGEWGSTELVVDPYTLAPSQIKISSIQQVDVQWLRAAAFSLMKDAK
jgi:HK97 family phage major capsid protein